MTKCVVWKHYRTKWQNVLFESITILYLVTKMCCLTALPYRTEWQNVLFESITLPYRVTKCVVWKHYPTIPSDKMCCSKALTYWVTKCVVWKHYCNEWQNVLFESTTVPSDKTCCWKHYPTIPSDKNVLFESINLPSDKMCCSKALTYQVTKCVVWKH